MTELFGEVIHSYTRFSDKLSLQIGPIACYPCEDTQKCGTCAGYGEIATTFGRLEDCRDCNGHGICIECTETEEECFGGYKCLCQLQEVCLPVVTR